MKEFDFEVVLDVDVKDTEEEANKQFEEMASNIYLKIDYGCLGLCACQYSIDVTVKAKSLEEAFNIAIKDVESCGYKVREIVFDVSLDRDQIAN